MVRALTRVNSGTLLHHELFPETQWKCLWIRGHPSHILARQHCITPYSYNNQNHISKPRSMLQDFNVCDCHLKHQLLLEMFEVLIWRWIVLWISSLSKLSSLSRLGAFTSEVTSEGHTVPEDEIYDIIIVEWVTLIMLCHIIYVFSNKQRKFIESVYI